MSNHPAANSGSMTLPSTPLFTIPVPMRDVSCQRLLAENQMIHHGNLRRRNTMNKMLERVGGTIQRQLFKWPRNYVILQGGCLYMFKSESSERAYHATSLYGLSGVQLCSNEFPTTTWPFKISSVLGDGDRAFYFSAPSQMDMQKWIECLNEQLLFANNGSTGLVSPPSTSMTLPANSTASGGVALPARPRPGGGQQGPPVPLPRTKMAAPEEAEYTDMTGEESDDSQDSYDKIPEELIRSSPGDVFKKGLQNIMGKLMIKESMAHKGTVPPLPTATNSYAQPPSPSNSFSKSTCSSISETDEPTSPSSAKWQTDTPVKLPPVPHQTTPSNRPPVPSKPGGKPPVMVKPKPLTPSPSNCGPGAHGTQGRPKLPPRQANGSFDSGDGYAVEKNIEEEDDAMYVANENYTVPDILPPPRVDALLTDAYWSKDATEGEKVMKSLKVDGAFMLRDSNEAGKKTLLVCDENVVRKYKVQTNEQSMFYIDAQDKSFVSLVALVMHYQINNLPHKSLRLAKPYTAY